MTPNEVRDWVGTCMFSKGFHPSELADRAFGGMVRAGLIGTEAAEALQEAKRHWPAGHDDAGVPAAVLDAVAEELADTAIRAYDLAYCHRLDLDAKLVLRKRDRFRERTGRYGRMVQLGQILSMAGRVYDACEDAAECPEDCRDENGDYDWDADRDGCGDEVRYLLAAAIEHCRLLCESVGRDLASAVDAKMAENMARPDRYGTPDAGATVARQVCQPACQPAAGVPAEAVA